MANGRGVLMPGIDYPVSGKVGFHGNSKHGGCCRRYGDRDGYGRR